MDIECANSLLFQGLIWLTINARIYVDRDNVGKSALQMVPTLVQLPIQYF